MLYMGPGQALRRPIWRGKVDFELKLKTENK